MLNTFRTWLRSTSSTIWSMKYLPFIGVVFMAIHCILLLNGINIKIIEFIVGFPISSMFMFFMLSKQFKFCILYKCQIGYVAFMDICIFLQSKNLWGIMLTPMRWIMLSIGILIIIWSFVHYITKKRGCD